MANDIMLTNGYGNLTDKALIKYTDRIMGLGVNIRKSMLKVAHILSIIDEKEHYASDGFASVAEYAESVLGIKKSQTNNLVRIGRIFVNGYSGESVLPHETNDDYNSTQLVALLPLKSQELALDLANSGVINPHMTVKDIKEAIEPYKPTKAVSESGEGEESEATETVHANAEDVAAIAYEKVEVITIEKTPDGTYVAFVGDDNVSITIEELVEHIGTYK